MSAERIDVLAVMDALAKYVNDQTEAHDEGATALLQRAGQARAAVAELFDTADSVCNTIELQNIVSQSTKNENAGFIDWRDWCCLLGEVKALRAALARIGGAS